MASHAFNRLYILNNVTMYHPSWLYGWLCFTSHQQRGHLETALPFTVPCEGREVRFLHRSHRESNPGPSRGSPLHYHCATPAPLLPSKQMTKNLRRYYIKSFI